VQPCAQPKEPHAGDGNRNHHVANGGVVLGEQTGGAAHKDAANQEAAQEQVGNAAGNQRSGDKGRHGRGTTTNTARGEKRTSLFGQIEREQLRRLLLLRYGVVRDARRRVGRRLPKT
jgi:hypothetical protein